MVTEIREWIFVISACISMVSVAYGVYISLHQYRVKLREEDRLALSSRAEVDVRLITAFTELMDIAMGRGKHVLSEKTVEELFKLGIISQQDFNENFSQVQKGSIKLTEYSVVRLGVGKSAKEAAIAAIATLAKDYPVLRSAALQGLEGIQSHSNVATDKLKELNDYLKKTKKLPKGNK